MGCAHRAGPCVRGLKIPRRACRSIRETASNATACSAPSPSVADAQVGDDVLGRLRDAADRADRDGPWPAETPPAADRGRDHVVVELRGGALIGAVDTQPWPQAPVIQRTAHTPPGQLIPQSDQMLLTLVQARLPIGHEGFAPPATGLVAEGSASLRAAPAGSCALCRVCSGRPWRLSRPAGQSSQPQQYRTACPPAIVRIPFRRVIVMSAAGRPRAANSACSAISAQPGVIVPAWPADTCRPGSNPRRTGACAWRGTSPGKAACACRAGPSRRPGPVTR